MNRLRKLAWRVLVGLGIIWGMLIFYPIRTGFFRGAIVGIVAGIVACLVFALWKRKLLRWAPLAPPAILGIFLLLPGREPDPTRLRAAYIDALQRYEGTRYVWGGEGLRGVDCSGLLRAALVDACVRESVRSLNPSLARDAARLWWNDASAREMGDGYGGWTRQLAAPLALKDAAADFMQPGDFAVTADGSHVLAYLGKGEWIQADPDTMRVMVLEPGAESGWWIAKVVPCRWRWLE